ncbi:MAG: SDR family NAD(P)-dependent oxidoreductase [Alphaproteobacteria bacterium]|nr:SDR family NAD(P)-dependent oxidoreductase [Alphaproteobacteria bacterium]MBU0860149.1 SDR family NAD(P)-dependent oxidoreductase [Alphaproteobacteria bacterium]
MIRRHVMRLNGKNVFITGGTGGIGMPLVALLRQEGALTTVYDQNTQGDLVARMEDVCATLSANPPDILINLAGYNHFARCEDQDVVSMLDINLIVPLRLIQAVLPAMKKRQSGHIVNMASMVGLIPLPHMTVYAASKAGLKSFSDALRREVESDGIYVTVISPRAVRTAANKGLLALLNQRTGVQEDEPAMVARRILKAIIRKEKDVRIGWPERFFAALNILQPSIIDSGLRKSRVIGEEIITNHNNTKEKTHETNLSAMRRAAL